MNFILKHEETSNIELSIYSSPRFERVAEAQQVKCTDRITQHIYQYSIPFVMLNYHRQRSYETVTCISFRKHYNHKL